MIYAMKVDGAKNGENVKIVYLLKVKLSYVIEYSA